MESIQSVANIRFCGNTEDVLILMKGSIGSIGVEDRTLYREWNKSRDLNWFWSVRLEIR